MANNPQPPPFSPGPPGQSRAVAWTALFFSLVACSLSGIVFFQSYDDGRLMDNLSVVGAEARKVYEAGRGRFRSEDEGVMRWDKVRDGIDRIEEMVRNDDERATYHIDLLKERLAVMRDYTSKKTSSALADTMDRLDQVQVRLGKDSAEAARRLKRLKDEISRGADFISEPDDEEEDEDKDEEDGQAGKEETSAEGEDASSDEGAEESGQTGF